jgi:hypothetical protein
VRILRVIACVLVLGGVAVLRMSHAHSQQSSSTPLPAPAVPADAESVRAEIRSLESALPRVPDRGATLFLLARRYAHLSDLPKALALLKECVALDAGFVPDPEKSPSLRPLESSAEFRELFLQARLRYPPVHRAKVTFTVPDKDLFPEGLGVDASNGLFYMGSMYRKKIVKFTLNGSVSDFVKQDVYDLSPVGGVHVDPADHSVWASTDAGAKHRPELLRFDTQGKLLER